MTTPIRPTYQVKLRLDPEAVLSRGRLRDSVISQLSIGPRSSRETSAYLDSADTRLLDTGRIIRAKHTRGRNRLNLTYKARYDLCPLDTKHGVTEKAMKKALKAASAEGIIDSGCPVEAEVGLSYHCAIIDFTHKQQSKRPAGKLCHNPAAVAKVTEPVTDLLPSSFATNESPKKLRHTLATAHAYGPVTLDRYPARIGSIDVDLEIVHFPAHGRHDEFSYVEVTVDLSRKSTAEEVRNRLISTLSRRGILLPEDAFKTELVVAHFAPTE